MVFFIGSDSAKFRITEAVFRFGADVRAGDDARDAQMRLIRDGEAVTLEPSLALNDGVADDAQAEQESEDAEDEQE